MDRHEFESLAIAEIDAIYRFARFLTRDAARAEDLVQEVYARALRPESVRTFRSGGGAMRAWLMTITRTIFYSGLQREAVGRRATETHRRFVAGTAHDLDAPAATELARIDWPGADPALSAAIDSLSPDLREVLWLWAVEGLKYRQISAALDIPIGTVMSRLHRARTKAARSVRLNRSHAAPAGAPETIDHRRALHPSHGRAKP